MASLAETRLACGAIFAARRDAKGEEKKSGASHREVDFTMFNISNERGGKGEQGRDHREKNVSFAVRVLATSLV